MDGLRHAATVTSVIAAPASAVWAVLSDGWLYAGWVVGASRIREVDDCWPAPGARIHHSVGSWPALLDDLTEVLAADAGRELCLRARAWPVGEAAVRLTLESHPAGTAVSMIEDVTAGPGRVLPRRLRQLLIISRNRESLRRLRLLAEGRRERTADPSSVQRSAE